MRVPAFLVKHRCSCVKTIGMRDEAMEKNKTALTGTNFPASSTAPLPTPIVVYRRKRINAGRVLMIYMLLVLCKNTRVQLFIIITIIIMGAQRL